MYISINWIKDFVDLTDIDIKQLINKFTLSTAEVEGITTYGYDTHGVVVGKVVQIDPIANSEKLKCVLVNIGDETVQSICGASNIQVGDNIPFAKSGAVLQGIAVKSSIVDGLESNGVCLSEKELGISISHDGVMILEENAVVGKDIKCSIPLEDTIFEVDNKSITNRPDLWGHYGIAREIAAITKRELRPLPTTNLAVYDSLPKVDIAVEDGEACYRYTGMYVENITKHTSPYDMKVRLFYTGLRSINLLADITNYIMLEIGQPMHAFDKRLVDKIEVKATKQEEEFVTLDNVTRQLPVGTLMIRNQEKAIGIAGIMGGLESQIQEDTTSLFLESATFDTTLIRKTAMKIGHRTDASTRYEKTLDPEFAKLATARFLYLLQENDSGIEITSAFTDVYLKPYPVIHIAIDKSFFDRYIGIDIPLETIIETLTNLKFKVIADGENLTVEVPSFRATKDVSQKADLIEEVARVYGYDNIEPKSNLWEVSPIRAEEIRTIEYETKRLLAEKYGLSETHSYVWYREDENKMLGIHTEDNLSIVNGLNKADSTLRAYMGPSMLYHLNSNLRYVTQCRIFEIGRTFEYHFDGNNCIEKRVLAIALASTKQTEETLLYEAKSMIEAMLHVHKNVVVQYVGNEGKLTHSWIHRVNSYRVLAEGVEIGYLSLVHPKIRDNINKKANMIVAEISMDAVAGLTKKDVIYSPISKYQTVNFDLTLIVEKKIAYQQIQKTIEQTDLIFLLGYQLVDIYENEEKLPGKKSVTIRFLIGSHDKTLSKEEIDLQMNSLIVSCEKNGMVINK